MASIIRDHLKDRLAGKVLVWEREEDSYGVHLPFYDDTGDGFVVSVVRDDGTWWITDEASTLMHLSAETPFGQLSDAQQEELLSLPLARFSIENRKGELRKKIVDDDLVGFRIYAFMHGLIQISCIAEFCNTSWDVREAAETLVKS